MLSAIIRQEEHELLMWVVCQMTILSFAQANMLFQLMGHMYMVLPFMKRHHEKVFSIQDNLTESEIATQFEMRALLSRQQARRRRRKQQAGPWDHDEELMIQQREMSTPDMENWLYFSWIFLP